MTPFLEEVANKEKLEKEIEDRQNRTINKRLYRLYGFTEEEIKLVEEGLYP